MARELTYTIRVLSEQAEEKARRVEQAMLNVAKATGSSGAAKAERELEAAFKDAERAASKLEVTVAKQKDAVAGMDRQSQSLIGTLKSVAGAVGIAFSVQQLLSFGKALAEDADHLTKLKAQTDLSYQGLQKFRIAGDDAGNTVDQLTQAVSQMQRRLSGGESSFVGALRELNIGLEDFRTMGPEQQFYALSDAIRGVPDPTDRARLAVQLFGRTGAEVLPTLMRGFDDLRDSVVGMSDETIEALAEWNDMWDAGVRSVKGWAATIGVDLVRAVQSGFNPVLASMKELERLTIAINAQLDQMIPKIARPAAFSGPAGFEKGPTGAWQVPLPTDADAMIRAGLATTSYAKATRAASDELPRLIERVRALNREMVIGLVKPEAYNPAGNSSAVMAHLSLIKATLAEWKNVSSDLSQLSKIGAVLEPGRALTPIPRVESRSPVGASVMAGLGATLREDLPRAIMSAIQGGGSVLQAAGSTLGSWLTSASGFGKQMTSGLTSMLGQGLGAAVSSLLPGIGALVGPLLSKMAEKFKDWFGGPSKQEMEGRSVEAQFEKQFRSFDDMANKIGDAYSAVGLSRAEAEAAIKGMLDAEKQGADAVRLSVEKLQGVLDRAATIRQAAGQFGPSQSELVASSKTAQEVYDYMFRMQQQGEYTQEQVNAAYMAWQQAMADAGNEAAKAWIATHKAAVEGGRAASGAMDALRTQRESLAQSIAGEAPEEVMGVIEAQTRGQIAALDAQIAAQQSDLDRQAQAAAESLEQKLGDIQPDAIHVPVIFDYMNSPYAGDWTQRGEAPEPGDVFSMAAGGYGHASKPTWFYTRGNEDWAFSGEGKSFSSGATSTLYPPAESSAKPVQHVYHINAVDAASFEQLAQRNPHVIADAALKGIKGGGKRLGTFRTMTRAVN